MQKIVVFIILMLTSTLSFSTGKSMSTTAPKVKLTTTLGDITIQLNPEKAPISAENFLTYVKQGFYEGTIFHRVIPGFMAQGGGFDVKFNQKPTLAPIKNEADNGLANARGTVAMARTNVPDSATAQFFINYKDNTFLNHTGKNASGWGYAVFAEVIEGMDVVDAMAKQATGSRGPYQDVPTVDIVITKAEVVAE